MSDRNDVDKTGPDGIVVKGEEVPENLDDFAYRFNEEQLEELKARPVDDSDTIRFILWSEAWWAKKDRERGESSNSNSAAITQLRNLQIIAALRVIDRRNEGEPQKETAFEKRKEKRMEFIESHDGKPTKEDIIRFLLEHRKGKNVRSEDK